MWFPIALIGVGSLIALTPNTPNDTVAGIFIATIGLGIIFFVRMK